MVNNEQPQRGDTRYIMHMLGTNAATAKNFLATVIQAKGETVVDEKKRHDATSHTAKTGLEMLADILHSGPMGALTTTLIADAEDNAAIPEQPRQLPTPFNMQLRINPA